MPLRGSGWSVEIKGQPRAFAAMAGVAEFGAAWNRETVKNASEAGQRAMKASAHEGGKGTGSDFPADALVAPENRRQGRPKLKNRIVSGKPTYRPGGAGGGGTWVAVFGVGGTFGEPKSHDPAWIHTFGSGVRGTKGFASGSVITSRSRSHLMTFMVGGKQVWARSVGGQRPHTQYVDNGVNAAQRVITQRIASFGRGFRQARTIG